MRNEKRLIESVTANRPVVNEIEFECDYDPDAFSTPSIQAAATRNKAHKKLTIKCDGLCETNPGGIGTWAFIIYDENGEIVTEDYGVAGEGMGTTNNVAEYRAVIEALHWLLALSDDYDVVILTDSLLVVNQVTGKWDCHSPHLRKLRSEAYELICINDVSAVEWIPRNENQAADALTRLAYKKALRDRQGNNND